MLIDGNLATKWCATSGNVVDKIYALNQVQHWVAIDLGSQKTFNTYTLYNTQSYIEVDNKYQLQENSHIGMSCFIELWKGVIL